VVITAEATLAVAGMLGGLIGALLSLAFSYGRSRQQIRNIDAELFGTDGHEGICGKVDRMMGKLDNGLVHRVESIDKKLDRNDETANQLNVQMAAMQATVGRLEQTVNRLPCTQPRDPKTRERCTDGG
jgi:hypothetical protein